MYQRFLQTEFWTSFKSQHEWNAKYFCIDNSLKLRETSAEDYKNKAYADSSSYFAVLTRSFSVKVKKFTIAYVPMAFEYDGNQKEYFEKLQAISQQLKEFISANTICVRFDPPIDFLTLEEMDAFLDAFNALAKEKNFLSRKSMVAVQPPDTTILNLEQTEDQILENMKSKWRYNIRLASKKGVCVEKYDCNSQNLEAAFEHFYELFEQTSKRDGVSFHSKKYYLDLLKKNDQNIKITLYLAKHEEDYLAGIITLFCRREAVYLYGASGNLKRNLMPAYLLQWTAIQDAKAFGSPCYDFYGMPPTDDENHPMHGLYLFKTGFGGAIIHRPGSFDIPLNKRNYSFYIKAEKLRAWYHKKFLKKIRGR